MNLFRSFLFSPGNHARRVEKALSLDADAVILDLEDAVAITEKPGTRALAVAALQRPRSSLGYIRVNDIGTEWCFGDLMAVVTPGVDGIVLPKVESADQLRKVDWLVGNLERDRGMPVGGIDILPIIETAVGLSAIDAIAASGTRTRRLAFGAGDFTLDLGLTWSRDEMEFLAYRATIVRASKAAGLEAPIDTVWIDLKDSEGFKRSAETGKRLGFQGKLCIHPDQIPVANVMFSPSETEIADAKRIITAFREAERKGLASIQIEGRFVDYPIVYRAERVLVAVAAIERRQAKH